MNNTARVVRIWSSHNKRVKYILIVPENGEVDIKPGDFVYIEDLGLPILDFSKTQNGIKLTVIYDDELPVTRFVELSKIRPKKSKIMVVGKLPNPIISILRQSGYELTNEEGETIAAIVTEPNLSRLPKTKRIIIAPSDSLSLSDYHYLNKLLKESGVEIQFNLNKPLVVSKGIETIVLFFSRKIYVPENLSAYTLKSKDGKILSFIKESEPILVASNDNKLFVASSIRLFYPYDVILEKGDNSKFLLELLTSEVSIPSVSEEKRKKKKKVSIVRESPSIQIDLGNLLEIEAFNYVIDRLLKLGSILKDRNDTQRKALLVFSPLGDESIDLEIKIRGGKLLLSTPSEKGDNIRFLRSMGLLIEVLINDLKKEKLRRNELRLTIRIISQAYRKLITVKDMVEIDLNLGEIVAELLEIIGLLEKSEPLKPVSESIYDYVRGKLMDKPQNEPLSGELKDELLKKIDEWYSEITRLVEDSI